VRYLAVSNRTAAQLDDKVQALASVTSNPARRIIGVQNRYNLLERPRVSSKKEATLADDRAFLAYLGELGIGLVPYVPLAVGLLTGRYRKGHIDDSACLPKEAWSDEFLTDRNLDLVEKLLAIAQDKGYTLAQLAIAWLLAHEATASVIAGVTKMAHLGDNVGAIDVTLTAEERAEIDALTDGSTAETV
jgi:aryl-alcohol dehydrogenase-like predicted oxidoreductase